MKRMIAVIFCALIMVTALAGLSGCGCSDKTIDSSSQTQKVKKPSEDIVGEWGERTDDADVQFNEDGTCEIGGVRGTYEVDDNNTLTVTPDTDSTRESDNPKPMVFEYYSGDVINSSVPSNQWAITDDTIYINGYQYRKTNTNTQTTSSKDDKQQSTDTTSKTEKSNPATPTSETKGSDTTSKSENSTEKSSPTEPTKGNSGDSSSKTETKATEKPTENTTINSKPITSPPDDNNGESSKSEYLQGEEDEVVVIYQNLDDFIGE